MAGNDRKQIRNKQHNEARQEGKNAAKDGENEPVYKQTKQKKEAAPRFALRSLAVTYIVIGV